MSLVVLFFLSISILPIQAQEECSGVTEMTVDIGEQFVFCWYPNQEPDVAGYRVYENGVAIIDLPNGNCANGICEPDPMSLSTEGTYTYYFTAYDGPQVDIPTVVSGESDQSDEIVITVINLPPMPPSGGCVKRIIGLR